MKKPLIRNLSLFGVACLWLGAVACGDNSGMMPNDSSASGGTPGSGGTAAAGSGGGTASGGAAATGGSVGVGGTAELCELPTLSVFTESETDEAWDDGDFSDVTVQAGCPTIVEVVWPHDLDWEGPEPVDANFEQVHFTLDATPPMSDLTGMQLNLTLELTDDMQGSLATAGGYIVSLLSVSQWDRPVEPGTGGTGAGGDTAVGGASGSGGASAGGASAGGASSGGASSGGASSGGASSGGASAGGAGGASVGGSTSGGADGAGGATVTTEAAYSEAETPPENRITFRYVGDRATVIFPLPAMTAEPDSYNPARVIKINVRIYSMFTDDDTNPDGSGGAEGAGGVDGGGGASGSGGANSGGAGSGGASSGGASSGGANSGGANSGGASAGGAGGASAGGAGGASAGGAGGAGGSTSGPVYDYLMSQFTITSFTITPVE